MNVSHHVTIYDLCLVNNHPSSAPSVPKSASYETLHAVACVNIDRTMTGFKLLMIVTPWLSDIGQFESLSKRLIDNNNNNNDNNENTASKFVV